MANPTLGTFVFPFRNARLVTTPPWPTSLVPYPAAYAFSASTLPSRVPKRRATESRPGASYLLESLPPRVYRDFAAAGADGGQNRWFKRSIPCLRIALLVFVAHLYIHLCASFSILGILLWLLVGVTFRRWPASYYQPTPFRGICPCVTFRYTPECLDGFTTCRYLLKHVSCLP
jgi:hypothetical protein